VTTPHRRLQGEPGGRAPAPRALRLVQQFINTYNVERSHLGLRTDEFVAPADLRRWLAAHGLLERTARVGGADLRRALEVREALRRLALAHNRVPAGGAAAAALSRLAREARLVIRFRRDGTMRLEPEAAGVVGALGRLLAAAMAAQMDGTWDRLKACRRCHWAFYDHSKNRSGRWCVMSICGNRMKAQAYRSHHRAPARGPSPAGPAR
jgi:predicted RNA-binding Zn ribbon-like protein